MSHDTGEEAKYHLSYRVTAFLDVLGQGEKLAMLKRMPQTTEEREETRRLLAETAGYVLQLRRLLKQYFERFRQPSHLIDDLPPDIQEQIRTARLSATHRGFSDSLIMTVDLKSTDEACTPITGVYGTLIACAYLGLSCLALERPIRGGLDAGLGLEIGNDEIYGPTLQRAYHLENRIADFPRIVIGDELWNYISAVESQAATTPLGRIASRLAEACKTLATVDKDGWRILHILAPRMAELWSAEYGVETFARALRFVTTQQEHWKAENHKRSFDGYSRLREYFEEHRALWEPKA